VTTSAALQDSVPAVICGQSEPAVCPRLFTAGISVHAPLLQNHLETRVQIHCPYEGKSRIEKQVWWVFRAARN
jgi:hypothetical protein